MNIRHSRQAQRKSWQIKGELEKKRVLFAGLIVLLLVVAMVAPASAHEGEHEEDETPLFSELPLVESPGVIVAPTCESQLGTLERLLDEYGLWEELGVRMILPDDPDHERLHAGELPGTIVEVGLPPRSGDFSTLWQGCHGTIYIIECRCVRWGYPHGPNPPPCIEEDCRIVDVHHQHEWNCD